MRAARCPLFSNGVKRTLRAANLRLRQRTTPVSSRATYLSESAVEIGESNCAVTRETAAQAHRAAPNGFACPCPGRLERRPNPYFVLSSFSLHSVSLGLQSPLLLLLPSARTSCRSSSQSNGRLSLRSRRPSAIFEPRSFPPFHLSCRPYPKTIRPSHRPLSPLQSYSTVV